MIVDKTTGKKPIKPEDEIVEETVEIQQMPGDGIIECFKAIKEILKGVRWEYGNPNSPLIFKTVQRDDGQFNRICMKGKNENEAIAFPACFIHFIDIHWLKPTSKVREGRATLRVRFIMNRLNLHDSDETETEVDYVAQRIKQEFEEKRYNYDCLTERLSLDRYDPVESFDDGLQPCWMTWDIWFRETSVWVKRKWVHRYIVMPPHTNHYDQDQTIEGINLHDHNNLDHPIIPNEGSKFVYGGIPSTPPKEEPEQPEPTPEDQPSGDSEDVDSTTSLE